MLYKLYSLLILTVNINHFNVDVLKLSVVLRLESTKKERSQNFLGCVRNRVA